MFVGVCGGDGGRGDVAETDGRERGSCAAERSAWPGQLGAAGVRGQAETLGDAQQTGSGLSWLSIYH